MTLRNPMQNPRTWLCVGMVALLVSALIPRLVHPTTRLGEDWLDATRGLFIGLSIGCNLLWVRRCGSARGVEHNRNAEPVSSRGDHGSQTRDAEMASGRMPGDLAESGL
ncbi:MAG: hypothetical protein ABI592_06435 [Acidobacteriota bacterium]